MTTAELKSRLLRVVGVDRAGQAPDYLVDAVVNAVNHAFQVLWLDVPRDRRVPYTRRLETLTFAAGDNAVQLASDVQSVLSPVRVLPLKTALMGAAHKSEVESYGLLRGNTTGETTNAVPQVYYVESIHQAASNSMRVSLIVAPTPAAEVEILIEVEVTAPSFVAADFCCTPAPAVPIPNDYAESLLLPIAAYHFATQSNWFKDADRLPVIQAEYDRAKARAGISDPTTQAPASTVRPSDR